MEIWYQISNRFENTTKIIFVEPKQELKNPKRNLVAAYNAAADCFCDLNADLFISYQDYIWLPEDGIERFSVLHSSLPDFLITGVTHISADPYEYNIKNLNGLYTIFKEPFTDKPNRIMWEDVRVKEIYSPEANDVYAIHPEHWESNWSAVPGYILKDGMRWDINFDSGIAYENMDFAIRCDKELGIQSIMDRKNISISLPHKKYFEGEEEEIKKFNNRQMFEEKWG